MCEVNQVIYNLFLIGEIGSVTINPCYNHPPSSYKTCL